MGEVGHEKSSRLHLTPRRFAVLNKALLCPTRFEFDISVCEKLEPAGVWCLTKQRPLSHKC